MPPVLTPRFTEAFAYAAALHARQVRKGARVPYLSHLMSVAALVLEDGGDEDEAIAGLLHDAVEDQGGMPTLEEIRRRFGERVARIVLGCTDSDTEPKPPWRGRKELYLAHLPQAEADVRRVSSADKLHNARSILTDYRVVGEAVWSRFTGGKDGTLWYYRSLINAFRAAGGGRLVEELDLTVGEIERLAQG
jgi:(p)ppGpp synthase/HD superfamily hydrolase